MVYSIGGTTMTVIPWFDQFYIGRGLNVASGEVVANVAIDYEPLEAQSTGQRTTLRLISVSSSRELLDNLGLDASASYLAKDWGISGEFELIKAREINNYYIYALIKVMVTNPAKIIRNPRLKPDALDLFINHGWDAFVKTYGQEYVEGLVEGGSYYALIEIQTTKQKDQIDIRSKLSGNYGAFKASTEFKIALQDILSNTAHNIYVSQSGGGGVQVIAFDQMIDHALKFPETALNNPVTISAFITKYDSLLPPIPDPNALIRRRQRDTLADLNNAYLKLRDRKGNLEFVLSHLNQFDEFRDFDATQLNQKRTEYQSLLDEVVNEIEVVTNITTRS